MTFVYVLNVTIFTVAVKSYLKSSGEMYFERKKFKNKAVLFYLLIKKKICSEIIFKGKCLALRE